VLQRLRPKLSYANVVSTLCLFLLLGSAGAYAASKLKANSVGTKQIKANAVNGSKVADNSLTGADINASTLNLPSAPVPSAPVVVKEISFFQAAQTPAVTVFSGNGLTLKLKCDTSFGQLAVIVDQENGLGLLEERFNGGPPSFLRADGAQTDFQIVGGLGSGLITAEYRYRRASDGRTATTDFVMDTTDSALGTGCAAYGTAATGG
jgi:hypothetical protein